MLKAGELIRLSSIPWGEDDAGAHGAGDPAIGLFMRDVGEDANIAARATAAKPLRPTPAIPAAPPDLVSNSGDTKDWAE